MYLRRPLCVFCLFFLVFLAGISSVFRIRGRDEGDGLEGHQLRFKGTIKQIESKNEKLILHIKNIRLTDGTDLSGSILFYIPDQENTKEQLHIGSRIEGGGQFSLFRPAYNRGQFDLRGYYALRGYEYVVYNGDLYGVSPGYNRVSDLLYRVKERTKRVYMRYFDEADCGVINALVLADKSGLDKSLKKQYQDAGIAHILALSGLHIATVGFLLIKVLRRTGLPMGLSIGISTLVTVAYCIMIGMPISAVRALIMYLLAIGAIAFGRTVDLRTSAAIACLIMLIINPDSLYDASFLMSFSSVLGIGLVYPCIRELVLNTVDRAGVRRLKRSDKIPVRLVMGLLSSMLLSISIQLAIMPFTMWFYYKLSVYGILVNLIVVPLAGALLVTVLFIGLFGNIALCIKGYGNAVDVIPRMLSYLTHIILKLYDLVTAGVDSLPGAVLVTGRPERWQMILYYLFLSGVCIMSAMLERRKKVMTGRIRKISDYEGAVRRMKGYLRRRSFLALSLCLPALIILFIRIQPAFELSALYVGQGQCFVIHGRDVPTVMYDCGSSDERDIGEYIVGPFLEYCGISRVDTVFVSHMDIDHVGGLIQMLEDEHSHVDIGRIVISKDPGQKKSDNYLPFMSAASALDIPVYKMGEGDCVNWSRLSVKGLAPMADCGPYNDLNDGSLVVSMVYKRRGEDDYTALFTGDISSDIEQALVDKSKRTGRSSVHCDFLQVAHHGSRFSANDDFISLVSPRIAVISAGINNQYGHPHNETLEILRDYAIPTYVTSSHGEVVIRDGSF